MGHLTLAPIKTYDVLKPGVHIYSFYDNIVVFRNDLQVMSGE